MHQVGVEGGHPDRGQRMSEEGCHVGAHAVVERAVGQFAGFDGARADGLVEPQAQHLVAVAGAAPVVPYGLPGGEGDGDAQRARVGPEGTRADVGDEIVVRPDGRRGPGADGGHRITSPARSAASSRSTRSRAPGPSESPAMTWPRYSLLLPAAFTAVPGSANRTSSTSGSAAS